MLMGLGLIQQAREVIAKETDNCLDLFRRSGAIGAKVCNDDRLGHCLCRVIFRFALPTACHA